MEEEVKETKPAEEKPAEQPKQEEKKELPAQADVHESNLAIKDNNEKIQIHLDKNKSVKEQAKDIVQLAATQEAVKDEELVKDITELKKDELRESASTSLKEEQVKSAHTEKELQHAKYGVYEGIADYIGLKKALPEKMLHALMYILMPLLIIYYVIVGFVTGIINISMDCLNAITERFAQFTKPGKKVIIFAALVLLIVIIFLVIKFFLNKYGIIDW